MGTRLYKLASLAMLALQNSLLALSMTYYGTRQVNVFLPSTAVVLGEIVKLFTSITMLLAEENSGDWRSTVSDALTAHPEDIIKMCIPSFIYTIQNNLQYLSTMHLDAVTFQLAYQLKILTTAAFSVVILKRRLFVHQWVALIILIAGIVLPHLDHSPSALATDTAKQNKIIGFCAVFTSSVLSGFAGIYFELLMKKSETSLWVRNIQLSIVSLPLGLITCFVKDWSEIRERGFLHGYDAFAVYLILLNAGGGLLVAFVVKYGDNILKGFATSVAIVLSCIISVYLFDFVLTYHFFFGALLVMISIFLYNTQPKLKINCNEFL